MSVLLSSVLLTGCGEAAPTEVAPVEQQTAYETLTGVIRSLGVSIYQEGTHRLDVDGQLVALLTTSSDRIQLESFIGTEVDVQGIIRPSIEGDIDVMQVVVITPRAVAPTGTVSYESFADAQYGFSVSYPNTLSARESRTGVSFHDGETKIIEIAVLENKLARELSDYLIDQYGYTADQLTRISVGGIAGYQFENATGTVIYLGHDTQIFALAWLDVDAAERARNKRYYLELVQSFAFTDATLAEQIPGQQLAALGEFCGGIAAIRCATGLSCRYDAQYPDAGGTCMAAETGSAGEGVSAVTSANTPINIDLPAVSEVETFRGWYYGDLDGKKTDTPDDWLLVDAGTRFAMWRRPDTLPEAQAVLSPTTATADALSSDQRTVFDYIRANIATIAPTPPTSGNWEVIQQAFAAPNYVYAIYTAAEQTRKILLVYTVRDGAVTLEPTGYFRPGVNRDWITTEGVDSAFGKEQTIVDATGAVAATILEGLREYKNRHIGYSLQYPKDWYWQNINGGQTVEFSDLPFPRGLVRIRVSIAAGSDFYFDEIQPSDVPDEQQIYVRFTPEQSMRISGSKEYAQEMQQMVLTFKKS